jgi:hypothetical protein
MKQPERSLLLVVTEDARIARDHLLVSALTFTNEVEAAVITPPVEVSVPTSREWVRKKKDVRRSS